MLHRPLIQAIEAFGAQPPYQQPLLGTVASILGAPAARQLAALRGGDADPEAAQALLSLLGCCLRQACHCRQVTAAAELERVLQLGLPLAVANAACHHKARRAAVQGGLAANLGAGPALAAHRRCRGSLGCALRPSLMVHMLLVLAAPCIETLLSQAAGARPGPQDTSHQAVGTLSALLALVLERGSPLHGALLGFAAQRGAALLEGLLLALLSLNSGSHLPKVRVPYRVCVPGGGGGCYCLCSRAAALGADG